LGGLAPASAKCRCSDQVRNYRAHRLVGHLISRDTRVQALATPGAEGLSLGGQAWDSRSTAGG
jgi:hypothetical protein